MTFYRDNKHLGIVYSTEQGRTCPECGCAAEKCVCKKRSKAPGGDGILRIYLERKGRKGKGVTIITGLSETDDIHSLAKELKQRCGTGGTVKNNNIEIQGDFRDIILKELSARGFKAKKSGG